ncbi:M16 family metallopeptidase [Actibacterium pelagium]|uniref:Peptidase M16 n=1 Tax=Actibacterium pelagium TaxID=2029103 RepID=A0A917EJL2_9RHOB|nr:pitrilysin family protein [Actibacterium pelagium]GGE53643.1 peptidase M16 [Actibacterium pelagium]
MMRLGLVFAGLLMAALPARAEPVTTFTLDNGMDVVVIEDHRAPVVVHMVWYRVGAADEPTGKSGIAHLFEHLMFKGTEKYSGEEFDQMIELNGGSDNAFTSLDYTGYFQRIAADRLELMMKLEADRMTGLILTEDQVVTERDVVLEERNERTDSDPGSLFGEQRNAAQYMNHPYAIPIIGWRHEIETLDLGDALSFYRTYYAPNNAILVVAGDVDPEEVRTLAETHYGPLEPSDLPPRIRPAEPPHLAERRLTFYDTRVAQPYVIRSYLAPERDPGNQSEAAALTYLADLLGGSGATSLMGERLQFDTQIAVYSTAFYRGMSVDDTTFGLLVVPSPGVTLPEAEAAMDDVIAEFLETGVDMEKFESLKMQLRASEIYARDSVQGLARRYGAALASGFSVEDVQSWPEVLQAVTPDDIMDAARNLFDKRRAVTGYLMKEEEPTQ